MNCVHIIPKDLCPEPKSLWINSNDAATNLSELLIDDKYCHVPLHIYRDCLVEDEALDEIIVEDVYQGMVSYPRDCFYKIQKARTRAYRACLWYDEIEGNIPCAKSIILDFSTQKQHHELTEHLEMNLKNYPFVRLCTMSSKSKIKGYSVSQMVHDILTSERTRNIFQEPYCDNCTGKHLFMREFHEYLWEVRCFWSKCKLTAVSLPPEYEDDPIIRKQILDFFKTYGKKIPYNSAIVDVGMTHNNIVEIIEFNTFGPDMLATAGNFSWAEEATLLLTSPYTVFR